MFKTDIMHSKFVANCVSCDQGIGLRSAFRRQVTLYHDRILVTGANVCITTQEEMHQVTLNVTWLSQQHQVWESFEDTIHSRENYENRLMDWYVIFIRIVYSSATLVDTMFYPTLTFFRTMGDSVKQFYEHYFPEEPDPSMESFYNKYKSVKVKQEPQEESALEQLLVTPSETNQKVQEVNRELQLETSQIQNLPSCSGEHLKNVKVKQEPQN